MNSSLYFQSRLGAWHFHFDCGTLQFHCGGPESRSQLRAIMKHVYVRIINMTIVSCEHICAQVRHRGDSSPCGQSPMDFESISLAAQTQCQCKSISTDLCINGLANNVHLPLHISRVSPAMTQISCGTRRRGEVRLGMYRAQARRISYFPPTASMWFIYSCGAA